MEGESGQGATQHRGVRRIDEEAVQIGQQSTGGVGEVNAQAPARAGRTEIGGASASRAK